ncbi:MAG TPA: hypothetical protein PKM25_11540 [Candidatus Ozemobacteraceae bacterium]|nr:hypothetical protein [Candidatus Ozemobacteraceae bacterium]
MRVLATILVLITSVVGFIFSYQMAYRNVVQLMNAPAGQVQTTGEVTK